MEKSDLKSKIELLVIGGSAGSFNVLLALIPKLKTPINFAIIVVLHRKSGSTTSISEVFNLKTEINVFECEDKDPIIAGNIYFAPADYHLLIENDHTFSLDYSEKMNYSRPSIDVTFKVAADLYGDKMAAILLSGANSDGAEGLLYVNQKNGTTIVQDPVSSEIDTMPKEALKLFKPDFIANVDEIIAAINNF
ncbi:chemotaxis protein CheB [Pedobacter arcticus]|uniref:chemotaxis protein CheB n=1 Tax=Pedobacter arcticus TaxID=752140 RepID=UPI0002F688DF|nr:chemotaxis protein CheB [Pedobacter arcticus]